MTGGFLNFNPSSGGGGGSSHSHPNLEILNGIAVDSFSQIYYNTGYNLSDLKTGSILCLLGSQNDTSGYNNNAVNTGSNYPIQLIGIDNQPALNFSAGNSQLRCPNLQTSLGGSSGGTIYTVFQSQNNGFSICEHTNSNIYDSWWRWDANGRGYLGTFRNIRIENYPPNVAAGSWQCWSIHSRSADYEVLINKVSQGVQTSGINGVTGGYWQGNDFFISPNWRPFIGNLALLIVIPFWVDKGSPFHQAKMAAIKGRFPSLPFT